MFQKYLYSESSLHKCLEFYESIVRNHITDIRFYRHLMYIASKELLPTHLTDMVFLAVYHDNTCALQFWLNEMNVYPGLNDTTLTTAFGVLFHDKRYSSVSSLLDYMIYRAMYRMPRSNQIAQIQQNNTLVINKMCAHGIFYEPSIQRYIHTYSNYVEVFYDALAEFILARRKYMPVIFANTYLVVIPRDILMYLAQFD